jgi:BirA family biotin operon repressor/biotin-[acetyl-CoA-carboxylase] ligase
MTAEAERWRQALADALAPDGAIRHVVVVDESPSTQDLARDRHRVPGTACFALRQTAGRGRLGRRWEDTRGEGLAATFVLSAASPETLAMRSAVAAARAVGAFVPAAGIKWPNDVVIDGRKAAGVLVECADGFAFVGIGINVAQRAFPAGLDAHATSLARAGAEVDRLAVARALLHALDVAWALEPVELAAAYRSLDRLSGRMCRFRTPAGEVQGRVVAVDPLRGVEVETAEGPRFLAAATTSVVPPEGVRRYGEGDGDAAT